MIQSTEKPGTVSPKEVARKMAFDYSHGVRDHTTRTLEAIGELCSMLEHRELDTDAFLEKAAELISKHFAIESVAIGVWDSVDRRYTYRVTYGLEKDVAEGLKKLSYTREQLLQESTYPSHDISKRTKIFLGEEHPYAEGEEFSYRRPGLIGMKRRSLTESLEADYLDFFMYGPDGEIIGFIETSGTRLRQLPDVTTIRWIELMTCLVGAAIRTGM